MPEPDYFVRQGDQGLLIRTVCEDEHSVAVSIANAAVAFHMKSIRGGTLKVNAAATNENSTATGQTSYALLAADTDTPGLYLAEFQVTFQSGAVQTFPNGGYILVKVTEQVA